MAKKEELRKLEKGLENFVIAVEILKKGIGYYVYYNKPNENTKIFKIHHSSCGNCAWGTGKIPNAKPGMNGVWIGPFSDTNQASVFINENLDPLPGQIELCGCIL
jgi:hypothetical protein